LAKTSQTADLASWVLDQTELISHLLGIPNRICIWSLDQTEVQFDIKTYYYYYYFLITIIIQLVW